MHSWNARIMSNIQTTCVSLSEDHSSLLTRLLFFSRKTGPLYLNRQIIVLLSHRLIDDRTFLQLQNDHQKLLSESLVYPERAYALLNEKLNRSLFPLRKLIDEGHLNLIQEPFFRQLIITIGKLELAQMRERTRLKLPRNSARNMIGIVDEYGILEYGQGRRRIFAGIGDKWLWNAICFLLSFRAIHRIDRW